MNTEKSQAIKVIQGKSFTVTLQSMLGSTNYGWCLASMPKEVHLFGQCNEQQSNGIAPVNQIFHFLAIEPTKTEIKINFKLLCLSDPTKIESELSVNVVIIPFDAKNGLKQFVRYSENTAVYEEPVGNIQTMYSVSDSNIVANSIKERMANWPPMQLAYGFPVRYPQSGQRFQWPPVVSLYAVRPPKEVTDPYINPTIGLKYGFPANSFIDDCGCRWQPSILPYGYPSPNCEDDCCCGSSTTVKYGYPQ